MKNSPDMGDIERVLRHELESQKRLYKAELAKFQSVTRDIPSGIPHPDGVARIRQIAETRAFIMSDVLSFTAAQVIYLSMAPDP